MNVNLTITHKMCPVCGDTNLVVDVNSIGDDQHYAMDEDNNCGGAIIDINCANGHMFPQYEKE
jgi:hypothetical protein